MPQLELSTWIGQIFWLVLTFSSMMLIMNFLVIPRLKSIFERREQKMSGDINRAKELQVQSQTIFDEYTKKLENAQIEADEIIVNASKKAQKNNDEQLEKIQLKMDKVLNSALNEIKKSKNLAISEMDTTVGLLSEDMLKKVLDIKPLKSEITSALKLIK